MQEQPPGGYQQPPPGNYQQPPPGQYPMPTGYQNDKVVGIIVMVLSGCGIVLSGLAMVGSGIVAAGGAAASANATSTDAANGAAAVGAAGGILMVVSIIGLIMSALGFAIGWGIMKSLRWAFLTGAIVYGLGALLQLVSFRPTGALFLVIYAGLCIYCAMRLTGKLGPTPS